MSMDENNILDEDDCLDYIIYNETDQKVDDRKGSGRDSGYVYILINPSLQKDLLKIGKTQKNPEKRAKQLTSTGVPTEFHVAFAIKTENYHIVEKSIHRSLTNQRYQRNREFFKLPL